MSIRRIRGKDGLSDSYSSFALYDSEVQSTVMNDFSGGVLTDGVSNGENKVFEMLNMEIVGKSVVSMSAPADAFSEALAAKDTVEAILRRTPMPERVSVKNKF